MAGLQWTAGAEDIEVVPLPDQQPVQSASSATLEENEKKLWLARRLFRNRDYVMCEHICADIIASDPQDGHALELQTQCQDILRTQNLKLRQRAEETRENKVLDKVDDESRVPGDTPEVPRPTPQLRGKTPRTPEQIKMDEKLNQRVSLNFINVDLDYLLNTLFKVTGVNIIADQKVVDGKSLTVHVEEMPLKALLDFITRVHPDLGYTVTPDAVWIVSADKPMLEPRVYPLNMGLVAFGNMSLTGTQASQASGQGGIATASGVAKAVNQAMGAANAGGGGGGGANQGGGQSYLEEVLGWVATWSDIWPSGSQYFIDKQTNSLMVITTPEMHKRIENILEVVDTPPLQILIRTKFVEISSTDSKDIGVNIFIPPDTQSSGTGTGGTPTPPAAGSFAADRTKKVGFDVGSGTNLGVASGEGFNIVFAGFNSDPQFQAILRALEKNTRAKLLSAPQIMALNNQKALIDVSTKFQYASEYTAASTTVATTGGTTQAPSIMVPSGFTEVSIGFHMEVTPSVGHDLKTIALELHPLVDDVEGGTDRFQQFDVISANVTGGTTQAVQRPIIKSREVVTRMIIEDGGVVVMGGLLRHSTQKVLKRVPILGYLPLIGLLFRSQSDTIERSNLFIIVQANIITPAGAQYKDEDTVLPAARSDMPIQSGAPGQWIFDYNPETERQMNKTQYPATGK